MPTALMEALAAHLDGVFAGPNGDYPAVLEALSEIGVAQAAWKPAPDSNSIWQIADHLAASKEWAIDMLDRGEASSPVWTEPAGDERAWQASLAGLKDAHARLKDSLEQVQEDILFNRPLLPDWPQTQLEFMLSWAAHEAFHAGQIDYLKGLQAGKPAQ